MVSVVWGRVGAAVAEATIKLSLGRFGQGGARVLAPSALGGAPLQ